MSLDWPLASTRVWRCKARALTTCPLYPPPHHPAAQTVRVWLIWLRHLRNNRTEVFCSYVPFSAPCSFLRSFLIISIPASPPINKLHFPFLFYLDFPSFALHHPLCSVCTWSPASFLWHFITSESCRMTTHTHTAAPHINIGPLSKQHARTQKTLNWIRTERSYLISVGSVAHVRHIFKGCSHLLQKDKGPPHWQSTQNETKWCVFVCVYKRQYQCLCKPWVTAQITKTKDTLSGENSQW